MSQGALYFFLSVLASAVLAYIALLPVTVAVRRRHHQAAPIFVLNVFSGLLVAAAAVFNLFLLAIPAVLFWVMALVWSVSALARG